MQNSSYLLQFRLFFYLLSWSLKGPTETFWLFIIHLISLQIRLFFYLLSWSLKDTSETLTISYSTYLFANQDISLLALLISEGSFWNFDYCPFNLSLCYSGCLLTCSPYLWRVLLNLCITASGSNFHQLLAAWKKRRKSPNLLKGLEPPAIQASNKGAPSLKGARPSWKGRALLERGAPHSNQHPPTTSTLQLDFPLPPHMAWDLLFLPAPSADPSSLLTPRPGGDHIPLPPF